jgi:hypothetical protein
LRKKLRNLKSGEEKNLKIDLKAEDGLKLTADGCFLAG